MTLPADLVSSMYSDYQRGMSMSELGRLYQRDRRGILEVFQRRGLKLRSTGFHGPRKGADGRFVPVTPATDEQIEAMVAKLTRLYLPQELRSEWRKWNMERRAWFLAKLRAKFPSTRPTGPFSRNVEPFDYCSPRAWSLMKKANAGRPSRKWLVRLFPASEGVIYGGRLFFWCDDGYYAGIWRPGVGRPQLSHIIWEKANGRPVPESQTVIFKDGNKNNFSPKNLTLRSRAECAIQNKSKHLIKHSREMTALLLDRHQRNKHEHIKTLKSIARVQP